MIKSAMILAAGLGKRMRPLTYLIPKPLILMAGKSMLERAFEHIKESGISNIVINSHYLAPLMEHYVKIHYPETLISHEEVLLETGGGIQKALPLLGEGAFFTLNGDSVWTGSNSLLAMQKGWDSFLMDALLLLIPRENAHGYAGRGDFFMSKEGQLTRPEKDQIAPYIYIGVQITHKGLFKGGREGPFSINLLWDKALAQGRLYGHAHEGEWFHMSTPEDIEKYELRIGELS